jgi:hypothetical protein
LKHERRPSYTPAKPFGIPRPSFRIPMAIPPILL